MTDYCQSIFAQGKHEFICPYPGCNVEWQYFLVKHVANLTQQQMKEFEARISKSELSKDKRNQMCPRCQTWCRRDDLVNNCMECPNCTVVQGGRKYLFCWACLCEWKSPGLQGNACGNPNCLDNRIQILSTCPEKMILSRMAPSVRGCPKCGTLYEYKEFCTQMHCSACNHFFCFYCLKGATTKAGLQCIPYNSTCAVASRQTVLPGILWRDFASDMLGKIFPNLCVVVADSYMYTSTVSSAVYCVNYIKRLSNSGCSNVLNRLFLDLILELIRM